jgi:hypothetical protein
LKVTEVASAFIGSLQHWDFPGERPSLNWLWRNFETGSETGRRLSVTPPQVAHIGSTDGSHGEQRNTVEVSPEEHAGAVRSDRWAD